MCFKKPNCDSVRQIEEEAEEGGGIVFDGGLDAEEDDEYDDNMWGHMVMAFGGPEMVLAETVQVKRARLVSHFSDLYLCSPR